MQTFPLPFPTPWADAGRRPVPPTPYATRNYVDALYRELLEKVQEGVPLAGSVRYDGPQNLTEAQRGRARANIGASAPVSVSWGLIGGDIASQADLAGELAKYQAKGSYVTDEALETALEGYQAKGSYVTDEALETALGDYAPLVDGKVPEDSLPDSAFNVAEYASRSAFPETGTASRLYVAKDDGSIWRWDGSVYKETAGVSSAPPAGSISAVKVDGAALPVEDDGSVDVVGKQDVVYMSRAASAVGVYLQDVQIGSVAHYQRSASGEFVLAAVEILSGTGSGFADGFAGSYVFSDAAGWTWPVAGGSGSIAFSQSTGAITLTDKVDGVMRTSTTQPAYADGATTTSEKVATFADEVPTTDHGDRLVSSGGVRGSLDVVHRMCAQNAAAVAKVAGGVASNTELVTALSERTYTKAECDAALQAKQDCIQSADGTPVGSVADTSVAAGGFRLVTSGAVAAAIADAVGSVSVPVTSVKVNGTALTPEEGAVDVSVPVTSVKVNGTELTPEKGAISLDAAPRWTMRSVTEFDADTMTVQLADHEIVLFPEMPKSLTTVTFRLPASANPRCREFGVAFRSYDQGSAGMLAINHVYDSPSSSTENCTALSTHPSSLDGSSDFGTLFFYWSEETLADAFTALKDHVDGEPEQAGTWRAARFYETVPGVFRSDTPHC